MGYCDERDRGLSVDQVSSIGLQQKLQIKEASRRSYATDRRPLVRNTYGFFLSCCSEVWERSRIVVLVNPAATGRAGGFDFTDGSGGTHRRGLRERECQVITIQDTEKMEILTDH